MILITRSFQQSVSTAEKLETLGKQCKIEALSIIQPYPLDLPRQAFDAIIITSQNAIMAIRSITWIQNITTYAIGSKTKEILEDYGFNTVYSANGDVFALIDMVRQNSREHSSLLYLRGDVVKTDLKNILTDYKITDAITYKTVYKTYFSPEVMASWDDITIVLFYSGSAAKTFKIMAENQKINVGKMTAVCISNNTAKELEDMSWQDIKVAARPTESDVFQLLL